MKHSCRHEAGRRTNAGSGARRTDLSDEKDRRGEAETPGSPWICSDQEATVGKGYGMGMACSEAGEMIRGHRMGTLSGLPGVEKSRKQMSRCP